ncbi:MAG: family 16 glycoside hydrolase [Planctomycetota bacterium]
MPEPTADSATSSSSGCRPSSDLSLWRNEDGGPPPWAIEEGTLVPTPRAGDLFTAQPFGDVQLHVEWAAPSPAEGSSQGRGNSGVFLMGLYEVQILDSYENDTYPDGQAAAIYGQYPPRVNACRPPGEWQSFDIVFRRPRFHRDGTLDRPARLTVLHNGILVQESAELCGPTMWLQPLPYTPHPDKLPLALQEHGNQVRFRNIWLRELDEAQDGAPPNDETPAAVSLPPDILKRYVGRYQPPGSTKSSYAITTDGQQLRLRYYYDRAVVDLVPHSDREFSLRWTAAKVVFDLDEKGVPTDLTLHIGGSSVKAKKIE